MPPSTLEQRVAALEEEVAELKSQRNGTSAKPWLRTIGAFAGDDIMKVIFAEAQKLREIDRKRSRRGSRESSKRPAKE